jgi:phosphatidylserine decarboxylase
MAEEGKLLRFLYHTAPGRLLLRPLAGRGLSRLVGRYLDSPLSRVWIRPFVKKNGIDLTEAETTEFPTFNACFTRRLRPECRVPDPDPDALLSPCDGLLRILPIREGTVFPLKESEYTVRDLLGGDDAAERYRDGLCFVFRLCVHHYHRYVYPADGVKGENVFLPGALHTVRPIALRERPVFVENCREYTMIQTERFGTIAQIEIGAMLVGRIVNRDGPGAVRRGEEKGMFLYGGSTIVLLTEPGRIGVPPERIECPDEIPVRCGERIGYRL